MGDFSSDSILDQMRGERANAGKPARGRGRPRKSDGARPDETHFGIEDRMLPPSIPVRHGTYPTRVAAGPAPASEPIIPFDEPGKFTSPAPDKATWDDFAHARMSAFDSMRPHLGRLAEGAVTGRSGKTLSTDTVERYMERATILFDQFYASTFTPKDLPEPPVESFVDWLIARKHVYSAKTWRWYKAAAVMYLEQISFEQTAVAIAQLEAADEDVDDDAGKATKFRKFVTHDDYERILFYCHSNAVIRSCRELADFAMATLRTGLRPIEWSTSEVRFVEPTDDLDAAEAWLFVCNAKVSNGRANGPIRAINLTNMDERYIAPIQRTIAAARYSLNFDGGHSPWISRMRTVLWRLYEKGGVANRYSPYSFRHQAIANWKSVYKPIEVAALAGHSIPSTATTHYGIALNAWSEGRLKHNLVVACPDDVARIVSRIASSQDARKMGQINDTSAPVADEPSPGS